MSSERSNEQLSRSDEDRREFLKSCGRFVAVTPPAVTMLLSTALTSDAIAASGSGGPRGGGDAGHRGGGDAGPRGGGDARPRGGGDAGRGQDAVKRRG